MDYIEDNKLIAEFMKGEIIKVKFKDCYYHNSWDWLMPVVEKIEALKVVKAFDIFYNKNHGILNDVSIYTNTTKKAIITSLEGHKNSKIKATYFAVVEFIKWLNEEK